MAQKPTPPRNALLRLWDHHPLYIHIATLFTLLVFIVGAVLGLNNYKQGQQMVFSAAEDVFERMRRESEVELERLRMPAEIVADWMSAAPIIRADSFETRMQILRALTNTLEKQAELTAIYIGHENGDFFYVLALRDEADRKMYKAPPQARYLVQHIERADKFKTRFLMLDDALNTISDTMPTDYDYDARTRPWYSKAMQANAVVYTAPYVFFSSKEIGITVARQAQGGHAVVGVDLKLARLSAALQKARMSPSSQLAIINAEGYAVAYSDPARIATAGADGKPVLAKAASLSPVMAAAAADSRSFAESRTIDSGGRQWLVRVVALGQDAAPNLLAVAVPHDELLLKAHTLLKRSVWLTLAVILLTVPATWLISRRIAGNLRDLTDLAAAIRRFDFGFDIEVRTRVNEIFGLGRAIKQMRDTIRKFLEVTTALSAERKFDQLLQRVLKEANNAAGGEGGVVYLFDDDGQALKPAAQCWNAGAAQDIDALSLQSEAHPVVDAARGMKASSACIVPSDRPAGLAFLDRHFARSAVQLVTVPLRNRAGEMIGVLCVFLPGSTERLSPERMALVEAFSGAGAAAIDNQRLLLAQKALLDSFIGLVAGAIDSKSPYTGGHCQRVPELTNMLTRAACDTKEGPFADFNLNEDQWEALHIAGWLHDCGKVTTPEYVVDKATKLETIYDRIHEVRMRFEVLKRDAEITCLKAIADGGNETELKAALQAQWRALDEEYKFVAACNEGGEFMAPEKVEKLKQIAARTWQRTLDDRIGVSWEERKRMDRMPSAPLPATEPALADKPEHLIERGAQDLMPPDNQWGFKLKVPQYKYNRGEIYNLAISRGTLTEEERYKINDHIVQTIIMLSKLPFPKHLKPVPELAGGHHEKMDGTGYPKCLRRDDMSVQARIMAIADIFEALTAVDRPYKKGKMLSEAVKIMSFMKKDRHIDPELFDLFLTSGVYRRYAEKYLDPKFIDEVNVQTYVSAPAAA